MVQLSLVDIQPFYNCLFSYFLVLDFGLPHHVPQMEIPPDISLLIKRITSLKDNPLLVLFSSCKHAHIGLGVYYLLDLVPVVDFL